MTDWKTRAKKAFAFAVYYGGADRLPYSVTAGFGPVAKTIRRWAASHLLDRAGDHLNVEKGAWFGSGKGVRIGDRSGLGLDCLVLGPLTLGDDVMVGPRCMFISEGHATDDVTRPMNQQGMTPPRPITVEDDVWIGAQVVVLPGVSIGTGSIVAAGSVVTKDVPPGSVVAGVPAAVVAWRS